MGLSRNLVNQFLQRTLNIYLFIDELYARGGVFSIGLIL